MEDKHWRKTTFYRRRPLMEDDFWQKMNFDGRRPLTEENLWRKTTCDGRQPLTEDDLWRKKIFDGRRPLMEDPLWWKTTLRTTSKTKRTCALLEGTRRSTYYALRFFFQSFKNYKRIDYNSPTVQKLLQFEVCVTLKPCLKLKSGFVSKFWKL